ncbi:coiled-coil domain-containing protein 127 [Rana temporaria]|uniref:coiled-coil domain-containing protein 127 n=1 Tax=Rana temporaria TaxID=8407 RepID=UPI001AADAD65|nr:coiled-coil domain-containing protein 127 [Rana temporaria]XP_040209365.1 coiled-coil domain-containing protein 127 [Rana temporaria]XP_040209366.1 coiled-coil domain-containing protein 127 [Rana temporaria]
MLMNNLNNPPRWNIQPNEDGNGSKWNYALLVPLMGLAAFRWIWSKESETQIRKAKLEYQQKINDVQKDLEMKYQDIVVENHRTVAHLQIELEREKNRTLSYRKALISQSRKSVEERKLLTYEQDILKQEIKAAQKSGAAGTLYTSYIDKEKEWQTKAKCLLGEFEEALKDRQDIYCSFVAPRKKRLEIEKNLLVKAATNPVAVELEMSEGLVDIFKHDTHCAVSWNINKYENGRLMWLYLKYWELLVDFKKFKRAEEAMIGK